MQVINVVSYLFYVGGFYLRLWFLYVSYRSVVHTVSFVFILCIQCIIRVYYTRRYENFRYKRAHTHTHNSPNRYRNLDGFSFGSYFISGSAFGDGVIFNNEAGKPANNNKIKAKQQKQWTNPNVHSTPFAAHSVLEIRILQPMFVDAVAVAAVSICMGATTRLFKHELFPLVGHRAITFSTPPSPLFRLNRPFSFTNIHNTNRLDRFAIARVCDLSIHFFFFYFAKYYLRVEFAKFSAIYAQSTHMRRDVVYRRFIFCVTR